MSDGYVEKVFQTSDERWYNVNGMRAVNIPLGELDGVIMGTVIVFEHCGERLEMECVSITDKSYVFHEYRKDVIVTPLPGAFTAKPKAPGVSASFSATPPLGRMAAKPVR